jgi:DNA-3-methyladenine glycosylase
MEMVTAATAVSSWRASSSLRPVERAFFEQPVVALARALLGQLLVRRVGRTLLVGRIVETEAYGGQGIDPSAHSFRGPTPRCEVMFGPAGRAYVYTTHQARCCLNVTATGDGVGKAVLLRALEPWSGADRMHAHRVSGLPPGPTLTRLLSRRGADPQLASGPCRLCQCLAVDRALNGAVLTDARSPLFIAAAPPASADVAVLWTQRVGLNPGSASFGWRWRALDGGSPAVSGPRRPAGAGRAPQPRSCPAPRGNGARRR